MQREILKSLLRLKIIKSKNTDDVIEEYIKVMTDEPTENLKIFLAGLLVFVYRSYNKIDNQLLLEQSLLKLKDLNIVFNTSEIDLIYQKIAIEASKNIKKKFVFDVKDLQSLKAVKNGFYWVQQEYSKRVTERLKTSINQVFEGNLARIDLAEHLKNNFDDIFQSSKFYFEGVADHIINQSQNIARINQSLKYDVKHFKVVARIDDKTSDVCRFMHSKIIPAKHLENQVNNILSAKTVADKKKHASWLKTPIYGKLPSNVGVPPYHFRCRTMIVPVWLKEEKVGEQKAIFADKTNDDELVHVDKTGVQRRLSKKNWTEHLNLNRKGKLSKEKIINALNSIEAIAPHSEHYNRLSAKSSKGYYVSFEDEQLVTMFKPKNSRQLNRYFKKYSIIEEKELIKWKKLEKWKLIFGRLMSGI